MIDFIKGKVVREEEGSIVLECAGIGYAMEVSDNTLATLRAQGEEQEVLLYVHEVLRDDAHLLYGFSTPQERALFRHLITVSGVGPATARLLLSAYNVAEVVLIVANGDHQQLKRVKGIGEKTAQRIVVDLQKKFASLRTEFASTEIASGIAQRGAQYTEMRAEALSALLTLGFHRNSTEKVLDSLLTSDTTIDSVEKLIKRALQTL